MENGTYLLSMLTHSARDGIMEKTYESLTENQFKAFDNMLEGITVYKLVFSDNGEAVDAKLEYVNPVTVKTMNISLDDAIGKSAKDLFGSDFMQPYLKFINESLITGKYKKFEVPVFCPYR